MQIVEANGARIPAIGFGTMTLKDNVGIEMTEAALRGGYRHLDTAQMYGNEREVGEGLRASGVKREDVFVTTKVWHNRLAAGDLERSVDESLERLKLPQVDLLLIHWPNAAIPLKDTLGALAKVKRAGLTKHIGVANFTVALIEEAVGLADEPLVTNQIEVHPVEGPCRLPPARHFGDRLLPDRARQGAGQSGHRAHRQGARQVGRAGGLAVARPAGRDPDPAHRQGRATAGKPRGVRFRALPGGDERDRRARAAGRPRGQSAARAQMGRLSVASMAARAGVG